MVYTTAKQDYHTKALSETAFALTATDYKDPPTITIGGGTDNNMKTVVRRLTPDECALLQGYPKDWCNIGDWTDSKGKVHKDSDSAKYKAYGNSICLPFWFYLLRRISATYDRPATLGSLFDGISGFPLAWARCNGSKTCLWSSEIEEFPIAVCKKHFGDDDKEEVGDIENYI